jgi:aspartate aminotransferase
VNERRNVSLNLNVRGLGQSATLAINQKVREMRGAGRTVYNLGLGESPFPVPDPLVESLRLHASKKSYLPVEGLPELREAVAGHMRRTQNVEVDPSAILVGPGSKELLFLLQLTFYGDLIVPNPCWVSYTPQSQIVGHKVQRVDTTAASGWKVKPDDLVALFEEDHDRYRPRLFVLNYPANPTGVSYTADELQELAKVAREYEVLILSDEIYSGLHHDGEHVSIARYYPEGTIVLNGISKWGGAGGWRLGTFAFPPALNWLRDAMAAVASETYTSVCTPIQYAAVKAFEPSRRMETYLTHVRRMLKDIAGTCHRILGDAGVEVVRPDGAFYLFPDFGPFRRRMVRRGIKTSRELTDALLAEAGVALLPGSNFQRPRDEFTARMSLVDFDGAAALSRSEQLPLDQPLPAEFAVNHASHLIEGMEQLTGWLDKRT